MSQILCEHVLEHVPGNELPGLLAEFHRVLKPGGWARVAVPDYGHPKHVDLMEEGMRLGRPDRTNPRHVTFTHYEMLRDLAFASPFGGAVFYEFWAAWQSKTGRVESDRDYRTGSGITREVLPRATWP